MLIGNWLFYSLGNSVKCLGVLHSVLIAHIIQASYLIDHQLQGWSHVQKPMRVID